MATVTRAVLLLVLVLLLLFSSKASTDFSEDVLNLIEGSKLNYSAGVEGISSIQSVYTCITKNVSATFEDFDLNSSLSTGVCAVCGHNDTGQKCAHQFNSSLTNIIVNRFQIDTINLFKGSVSLGDNGTKIICAYATDTGTSADVQPYKAVYLNITYHRSNNHSTLLVAVVTSSLVFFILVICTCVCVCAILLLSVSTTARGM